MFKVQSIITDAASVAAACRLQHVTAAKCDGKRDRRGQWPRFRPSWTPHIINFALSFGPLGFCSMTKSDVAIRILWPVYHTLLLYLMKVYGIKATLLPTDLIKSKFLFRIPHYTFSFEPIFFIYIRFSFSLLYLKQLEAPNVFSSYFVNVYLG